MFYILDYESVFQYFTILVRKLLKLCQIYRMEEFETLLLTLRFYFNTSKKLGKLGCCYHFNRQRISDNVITLNFSLYDDPLPTFFLLLFLDFTYFTTVFLKHFFLSILSCELFWSSFTHFFKKLLVASWN